jgi:arylsulfatase A-like enzyme
MITRNCGLAFALTLMAAANLLAQAGSPNVIWIISDDAGYNEFSMHGSKLFSTPRIDSIAKNGIRFTNGYVSAPVCSPMRAGILTGRYQNRFGHEFNVPAAMTERNGMDVAEKTAADFFKDAGYRTIAVGKWHLGYTSKYHPLERGFTDYFGFLQGQRSYFPLQQPNQLNRLSRNREPVSEKFDYLTDELGRSAAEYISQSKDKPFFMYVCFNATHAPREALPADLKTVGTQGNPTLRAMSLALDRSVGLILDELQNQSLTENTIVVFINDNGGAANHNNSPLRGLKGTTWEGGIRVPFAIQWPAGLPKKGIAYDHPVISLDILPTVAAAAGVDVSHAKPLDGVNLLPFLRSEQGGRPHQTLYWRFGDQWAVRDGDLKLISTRFGRTKQALQQKAPLELYDLSMDAGEQNNLAGSRTEEVERLVGLYQQWSKSLPAPYWRPKKRLEVPEHLKSAK